MTATYFFIRIILSLLYNSKGLKYCKSKRDRDSETDPELLSFIPCGDAYSEPYFFCFLARGPLPQCEWRPLRLLLWLPACPIDHLSVDICVCIICITSTRFPSGSWLIGHGLRPCIACFPVITLFTLVYPTYDISNWWDCQRSVSNNLILSIQKYSRLKRLYDFV